MSLVYYVCVCNENFAQSYKKRANNTKFGFLYVKHIYIIHRLPVRYGGMINKQKQEINFRLSPTCLYVLFVLFPIEDNLTALT